MSMQRAQFEAELRKAQPDWPNPIDNLNALNMTEMLDTLNSTAAAKRPDVLTKAEEIMRTQRGWTGSYERIKFASDALNDHKITWYPADLPDDQADDVRNFLQQFFRITNSRAGTAVFDTLDKAAICGDR